MIRSMPIAAALLLMLNACSGATDSDGAAPSEDALAKKKGSTTEAGPDLKAYGLAAGIIATGADARKLYEDIKKSGGRDLGNYAVLAGLTGEELGFTDADDKKESFGISCQAKEGDSTFSADTCSLNAVVKMEGQEKKNETSYVASITGKLAKGIAGALPRTSPAGLVGSMTTGSGRVSCKSIPGPAGATCTVPIFGVVSTLDEAVNDSESHLKREDAAKIIAAFF